MIKENHKQFLSICWQPIKGCLRFLIVYLYLPMIVFSIYIRLRNPNQNLVYDPYDWQTFEQYNPLKRSFILALLFAIHEIPKHIAIVLEYLLIKPIRNLLLVWGSWTFNQLYNITWRIGSSFIDAFIRGCGVWIEIIVPAFEYSRPYVTPVVIGSIRLILDFFAKVREVFDFVFTIGRMISIATYKIIMR